MCQSAEKPIMLRIQSQKKLRKENWKIIRKAKQLSTYRGLEGERGYSWGEKANILECSFENSTKFLTNRDGSIKRL